MKLLKTLGLLVAGILLATTAQAKPEFLVTLSQTYPQYSGPLMTRGCANCHVSDSDPTMNPYGAALKAEMQAEGANKLTADILHKLDNVDSDKDGVSNLDEIKAGTAPGDPKSVPAAKPAPAAPAPGAGKPAPTSQPAAKPSAPAVRPAPHAAPPTVHVPAKQEARPAPVAAATHTHATVSAPKMSSGAEKPAASAAAHVTALQTPAPDASSGTAATSTTTTTRSPGSAEAAPAPTPAATPPAGTTTSPAAAPTTAPPSTSNPLLPDNMWHPAIVHFPIALFIAGMFLDILGYIKKNSTLLLAGWYNLLLAAISAVFAVVTGGAAMMRLGLPFKGLIAEHLSMAVIASFLMWMMVSLRVHRHQDMSGGARALYYLLALITVCLLGYAAHLGGAYVYGS
ncbi:MAG TPA: DUF2231 domain-containing protein [Armatimonadota bacterium]|nr:DUF2231 domain-containing protein [Armatimonadota bacterium]